MAQFFDDIEKWNRSIEEMFVFIGEISWISLLYNNDMDDVTTETWIKYYIFSKYTTYLNLLYKTLNSFINSNNLFYSILKAQLRENLIRRRFKKFEVYTKVWEFFNNNGFRDTVHYPLTKYKECHTSMRDQILRIQLCYNICLGELERSLNFYETLNFIENTNESRQALIVSIQFSRIIIIESSELQDIQNQQWIIHLELMNMLRAFDNR